MPTVKAKRKSSAKSRPLSHGLSPALESGVSPESYERHGNFGTYRVDLHNKLWEVKYSPSHGLPYVILATYKTLAGAGRKIEAAITLEMKYGSRRDHYEAIRPSRRRRPV